jgi:hypothetical protein
LFFSFLPGIKLDLFGSTADPVKRRFFLSRVFSLTIPFFNIPE